MNELFKINPTCIKDAKELIAQIDTEIENLNKAKTELDAKKNKMELSKLIQEHYKDRGEDNSQIVNSYLCEFGYSLNGTALQKEFKDIEQKSEVLSGLKIWLEDTAGIVKPTCINGVK